MPTRRSAVSLNDGFEQFDSFELKASAESFRFLVFRLIRENVKSNIKIMDRKLNNESSACNQCHRAPCVLKLMKKLIPMNQKQRDPFQILICVLLLFFLVVQLRDSARTRMSHDSGLLIYFLASVPLI